MFGRSKKQRKTFEDILAADNENRAPETEIPTPEAEAPGAPEAENFDAFDAETPEADESVESEPKAAKEELKFGTVAKYALKYFADLPRKWHLAGKDMMGRRVDGFKNAGAFGKGVRAIAAGVGIAFLSMVTVGQFQHLNNHELPDDPDAQGSIFINKMVRMIEDESDDGYGPSAAFYRSTYYNMNRKAFQRGEMDAWWTVLNGMQQFVMTDGTGQANDPDLVAAFNSLKKTNEWSISSAADAAEQLKAAVKSLKRYNQGLVDGKKRFVPTIANINYIAPIISGLLLTEHNKVMEATKTNWKYNVFANREAYFHALGVLRATYEMSKGIFADHWEVLNLQSSSAHATDTVARLGAFVGESEGFFSKNSIFIWNGARGDNIGNDLIWMANALLRAKDKMDDVPKNFGGAASGVAAPSPVGNPSKGFKPAGRSPR